MGAAPSTSDGFTDTIAITNKDAADAGISTRRAHMRCRKGYGPGHPFAIILRRTHNELWPVKPLRHKTCLGCRQLFGTLPIKIARGNRFQAFSQLNDQGIAGRDLHMNDGIV